MRHSALLSTLLLSVSTLFYGCGSSSSTQSAPTGKEDQTVQTSKAGITGYSSDNGVLSSYSAPELADGSGKKLMAIYMVGSDLEENGGAGTNDLQELIDGYYELSESEQDSLDIVVAFGGSNKEGWRGMRIASMAQIIADDEDGKYGNLEEYIHHSPEAHMGDESSLELFIRFLKDGYADHDQKVLTMWDHGSAYGSFGNDSNFKGDGLSMAEMDTAFENVGLHFDIIGYDACLNANFELASVTKKYARYHIGSEELEPGHGWNYTAVVPALAQNSDLELYGKTIIDNFVKHSSHPYKSDGKTLSMVDLNHYDGLKTAVDALASYVDSQLTDTEVKTSVIQSAVKSQQYGKSARGDKAITIDLKGFSNGIASELADKGESALTEELNTAFGDYVVYSKQDGTRPNSNGVTIAPPEGYDDYNENVAPSSAWYAMTRSMQNIISDDTTAPTISDQDSQSEADESDFDDYEEYYSSSAKSVRSTESSDSSTFLGPLASFSAVTSTNKRANTPVSGTRASFHDTNLQSVKTVYGNIITEEDGTKYFATVATLQSLKTNNVDEYFTPTWNQQWYVMSFGDSESDSSWLSMEFESAYSDEGVNHRIYSTEIDYVDVNKDYSAYEDGEKFDYAKLSITVDEDDNVVLSSVRPYKIVYQSATDTTGSVLYDKASHPLEEGDKITLLAEYYDLQTNEVEWFYESDTLTIKKTPTFALETLIFDNDEGEPLDYYYMMIGSDISGNWVSTEPAKANLIEQ